MSFSKGQLVLYFEEEREGETDDNSEDTSSDNISADEEEVIDRRCYILYDKDSQEYFITGKRFNDDAVEYNFYGKKALDIYSFLINTIEENSTVNLVLYNFINIYENAPVYDSHPYLDFTTLDDKSEEKGIIISSFYHIESSNFNKIINMLKLLKTIRY